jgi:hypothetical protein
MPSRMPSESHNLLPLGHSGTIQLSCPSRRRRACALNENTQLLEVSGSGANRSSRKSQGAPRLPHRPMIPKRRKRNIR